jgi:nucleoside-diphosphate-sugar epimerase
MAELVTGGLGQIGRHIVEELHMRDRDPVARLISLFPRTHRFQIR